MVNWVSLSWFDINKPHDNRSPLFFYLKRRPRDSRLVFYFISFLVSSMLPLISNCYDYTTTTLVTYTRANWKHPRKSRRFPTRSGSLFSLKISTIAEHTKNENNFAFFPITKNNVWMHWEPQRWFCTLEEPAWCSLAKHLSSFSFFLFFLFFFLIFRSLWVYLKRGRLLEEVWISPPNTDTYEVHRLSRQFSRTLLSSNFF